MTFLQTLRSNPFDGHTFSDWFRNARYTAGVDKARMARNAMAKTTTTAVTDKISKTGSR